LETSLPIAQSVLSEYFPAAVLLAVVLATAVAMLGLSYLLSPRRRSAIKESTYECGMPVLATARQRFSVKFYLVAILFVLFDIETVFLIPWAVKYRDLLGSMGIFALVEMVVFLGVLGIGLLYAWKRGGLEWD
jgi:NADH-quinone oxidoreductase subunit A